MSRSAVATAGRLPGDIVLGDRGFCSFAHIATLLNRRLHGVFRAISGGSSTSPGPTRAGRGKAKGPHEATIRPHSRWVRSQGQSDQVVIWHKPKCRPMWMSQEEYDALPEEITVASCGTRSTRRDIGWAR